MLEKAFAKVPRARMFETTGIQFLEINSLFQVMAMAERIGRCSTWPRQCLCS